MLTHEGIWSAIDRLASRHGLTPSGLARRAGLDPTTFNKSKRFAADGRPRWPSTESIAKILKATGCATADLFAEAQETRRPSGPAAADGRRAPLLVPLLGEARAGSPLAAGDGDFSAIAPIGRIEIPAPDEEPIYAVHVVGDSMEPVYPAGTTLLVSLSAPVRPVCRVVVKTGDEVLVKTLCAQTAEGLELAAADPAEGMMAIPHEAVDWVARIVWASQ